MMTQVAAAACASMPLENKKEAVRRILASMTVTDNQYLGGASDYPDQDVLNLGHDYQEEASPQGPPTTSS